MLVVWDASMATGVESIDEQHQLLLEMLNELHEKMNLGEARQAVLDALQGLRAYTAFHFQDEERLLLEKGYPELEAHKQAHQEFVSKLDGFQEVVNQDSLMAGLELLHFLKKWLTGHIKGTDMEYARWLHQH